MSKQQMIALCGCTVALYTGIGSIVGVLPVYLAHLGASANVIGFVLAFAYLALAISNTVGGWLADRLRRRRPLLILGGALAVPASWLMSAVTALAPLMLVFGCLWFVTGIAMTMVNILAGLSAERDTRGGTFGTVNLCTSLGLLLGSLWSGRIADQWGYPALFVVQAVLYLLVPLAGFAVREPEVARASPHATHGTLRGILSDRTFLCLFVGSIIAQAANSVIWLGRVLIMHSLRFDASAITTAAAVGLVVTLPLPLLIGRLSDRLGRAPLLILCFLTTAPGLAVLALAADAWQFWVASALQTVLGMSLVAGAALLTDSIPEEALGTALALWNATPWIGIVLGLSGGGVAIRALHMRPTLLLSALLSLLATLVLLPLLARERGAAPARRVDTAA